VAWLGRPPLARRLFAPEDHGPWLVRRAQTIRRSRFPLGPRRQAGLRFARPTRPSVRRRTANRGTHERRIEDFIMAGPPGFAPCPRHEARCWDVPAETGVRRAWGCAPAPIGRVPPGGRAKGRMALQVATRTRRHGLGAGALLDSLSRAGGRAGLGVRGVRRPDGRPTSTAPACSSAVGDTAYRRAPPMDRRRSIAFVALHTATMPVPAASPGVCGAELMALRANLAARGARERGRRPQRWAPGGWV